MADEPAAGAAIAPPAQPATPPPADAGPQSVAPPKPENGRTFSQDELNSLLAAERRKLQDSEELKAGKAAQKRLAELEEANKTEAEKLNERATKAETTAQQLQARYETALKKQSFTTAALAKGIPHDRIDAAFRLADFAGVSIKPDSDEVSGMETAIASLPEWLSAPVRPGAPDINAGPSSGARPEDAAAREAEVRRKFRLG